MADRTKQALVPISRKARLRLRPRPRADDLRGAAEDRLIILPSARSDRPAKVPDRVGAGQADCAGEQGIRSFRRRRTEGFGKPVKKSAMILFATFAARAD